MARTKLTHTRWITALAAVASIAVAASSSAQTATSPAQPAPAGNLDLVKQQLTKARNTLSAVTQLPAAAQLTGETRTQVQQLINNFNELITTGADWRASYTKVEANLAALLGPVGPAPASGTPGAVGTSGTSAPLDPAIRDMLVQFRDDLKQFERIASGSASPPAAAAPAAAAPTAAPPAGAAPAPDPTRASAAPPADEKPNSPPAAPEDSSSVSGAPDDVLLHVEAIEVILGAQAAAQTSATAAAGGAVVSSETPSGSTKTTITGPNVTLTAEQLGQISTHLKAIRRLVEKK
jgi:hypothetical protein